MTIDQQKPWLNIDDLNLRSPLRGLRGLPGFKTSYKNEFQMHTLMHIVMFQKKNEEGLLLFEDFK